MLAVMLVFGVAVVNLIAGTDIDILVCWCSTTFVIVTLFETGVDGLEEGLADPSTAVMVNEFEPKLCGRGNE